MLETPETRSEATGSRTKFQIFIWWELRRIAYNLLLAVSTLVSLKILNISLTSIEMGTGEYFLFLGFLLIALIGNVIYTFGWIIEIFLKKAGDFRIRAFRNIVIATLIIQLFIAVGLRFIILV